jgi:hypothetical protein
MGKVYRIKDYPPPAERYAPANFFTRAELNLLLSLYSRHVMSGEWRDYAIDRQDDMAVFSIFRRTFEGALPSPSAPAAPIATASTWCSAAARKWPNAATWTKPFLFSIIILESYCKLLLLN